MITKPRKPKGIVEEEIDAVLFGCLLGVIVGVLILYLIVLVWKATHA